MDHGRGDPLRRRPECAMRRTWVDVGELANVRVRARSHTRKHNRQLRGIAHHLRTGASVDDDLCNRHSRHSWGSVLRQKLTLKSLQFPDIPPNPVLVGSSASTAKPTPSRWAHALISASISDVAG